MRQKTETTQIFGSPAGGLEEMCTLPPDQLASRLAEVRRDVLPYVRKTDKLEDGYVLEFSGAPGLKARVERLIALERECCEGLQFDLSEEPQAGGLRLEVRGIDPEDGILKQLFSGSERGLGVPLRGSFLRRALSSAGIGIGGTFLLFCVLPIGLAGLLGASATAYLAKFDSLPALSAAAVVFGGAAWWHQRRRPTPKGEEGRGGGCGC